MDQLRPIYTETAECQDCYKCVRGCPVKAIRIENGNARVMQEFCTFCGHCVEVCPVGAKRVRQDLPAVKRLLADKSQVWLSLAPSWVGDFPGISSRQLTAALQGLGFAGVSETALGAELVSKAAADLIADQATKRVYISTACPAVVNLVERFYPALVPSLTALTSPLMAHARFLRQEYGPEIGVVFAGPCIAKKCESDAYPETVNQVLTFRELADWLEGEGVDPGAYPLDSRADFQPQTARAGRLYPVDGGMLAGIRQGASVTDTALLAFSGMEEVQLVLADLENLPGNETVFLELLACKGGCINGPDSLELKRPTRKRLATILHAQADANPAPSLVSQIETHLEYRSAAPDQPEVTNEEILQGLRTIGKYSAQDELNCSGCGYDSCRDFARALILKRAEPEMCVSWMRKLAQKKANALIRTMPAGIVLVDDQLKVVECNQRFASLLGDESLRLYRAKPGLEGANLEKLLPFHQHFANLLATGGELIERDIRLGDSILHLTLFTIEKHRLLGAIMNDVTRPEVQKDRIITKSREVIKKNLQTVQKIAHLLGENAAETEVLLASIIESFKTRE